MVWCGVVWCGVVWCGVMKPTECSVEGFFDESLLYHVGCQSEGGTCPYLAGLQASVVNFALRRHPVHRSNQFVLKHPFGECREFLHVEFIHLLESLRDALLFQVAGKSTCLGIPMASLMVIKNKQHRIKRMKES